MPEVRSDMEGGELNKKKEEFVAKVVGNWRIMALAPSYVLFNLRVLSIVIAGNVALGKKLLPVVDIGDCYGR